MPQYRRAHTPGATYFFTLVSYRRQNIILDQPIRQALRKAIISARTKRPFTIDAWVLLPDHLHCIWTLPPGDSDFSTRWAIIKRKVSLACGSTYKHKEWINESKKKHRESTLWQRRFWEHQIRDDADFSKNVDYIHYNPVKHHLCQRVVDWPFLAFIVMCSRVHMMVVGEIIEKRSN